MRRERSDNIKVSLLHIPKLLDRDDQNRLCDYKWNTRDESPAPGFSLPAADTGETPHRNNHVHVIAVAVIFIFKFINI